MTYARIVFAKVKSINAETAASTTANTANSVDINGPCSIQCTTGVIYINPTTTATSANGWIMEEGDSIDLFCRTLSILSTSTSAKRQIILWES